jgi:phosphoribosylaminoimidazole carboxylase PurE protein
MGQRHFIFAFLLIVQPIASGQEAAPLVEAIAILREFSVFHELRVVLAHRTPERAHEFGKSARSRGVRIIIAGAGKAAHLAGVLASLTTVPVIGVPIKTSDLGGLDSLLSTVQMPGGIPVATTAIGRAGAKNAGLLAVAILALSDNALELKFAEYRETISAGVEKPDPGVQGTAHV